MTARLAEALGRIRSEVERHLFLHRLYQRTFSAGDGPLVLQDLARFAGSARSSVVFGAPDHTAYNEGRRAVLLYIGKRMRLSPEELAALEQGEPLDFQTDPLAVDDERD